MSHRDEHREDATRDESRSTDDSATATSDDEGVGADASPENVPRRLPTQRSEDPNDIAAWRRKVFPWATRFLVWSAVVFALLTVAQLAWLQWHIMGTSPTAAGSDVRDQLSGAGAHIHLELTLIERRYAQSNALLLSRTWVKYLGFLTGMLMLFVGATYIIGRFVEHEARLEVGYAGTKGVLTASSPGIIVSTLGTVVIVMSIYINHDIDTRDGAVYLARGAPFDADARDANGPADVLPDVYRTGLRQAIENEECDNFSARRSVEDLSQAIESGAALSQREQALLDRWNDTCEP